jgi:hypothetical protein
MRFAPRRALLACIAVVLAAGVIAIPAAKALPTTPLRTSENVQLVANIPGSYAGMVFDASGTHAYATGWATGLTIFDLSDPANPTPTGVLPLPHFENEDVDLCGDTLLISNDREEADYGAILHVIDVANPSLPTLLASLPIGMTGEGRGAGHIANFVNTGCTQVWLDGGDDVEVIDLSDRSHPRSLGAFKSYASVGPDPEHPTSFEVTHDSEVDSKGIVWNVGGGGIAGYRVARDPLKPLLVATSGEAASNDGTEATSPYNDFIMHNTKRMGSTLLVTEEDYIDTDQDQPGSCNGQGKFETWSIKGGRNALTPLDTWKTELNGFLAGGSAQDSKAPVTVNCSSHWFEERGGIAAVGWYEQGVRFLDVRNPKDVRQIGYYLPADGATWAAYWAPGADDIVYTADPARGIDVLRIGNVADSSAPTVTAPILSDWFGAPGTPAGPIGFDPSRSFGWSCAIKTS